jgi:hypothetical protein
MNHHFDAQHQACTNEISMVYGGPILDSPIFCIGCKGKKMKTVFSRTSNGNVIICTIDDLKGLFDLCPMDPWNTIEKIFENYFLEKMA